MTVLYNKKLTEIILHLGSNGIHPKICFWILKVHIHAFLFTSSSFMFKTSTSLFLLGVASISKVKDYI